MLVNEYMEMAIKEAKKAIKKQDVPVGAVIVSNNKVLSKACNNRYSQDNVLGHAEVLAIQKAQKKLRGWRMNNCEMYVTLEPCEMCKKIILEARLSKVYFLVDKTEQKAGYQQVKFAKIENYDPEITGNYCQMLSDFFINKR